MVQIRPWYNLRGLNICITWVSLYGIYITYVNVADIEMKTLSFDRALLKGWYKRRTELAGALGMNRYFFTRCAQAWEAYLATPQ